MNNFKNALYKIFDEMEKYGIYDIFIEGDMIVICLNNNTWRCLFTNNIALRDEFISIKNKLKERS